MPDTMLLHVCCAPCLATALSTVRRQRPAGVPDNVAIFFYNPNIHPLLEFRRRKKALQVYLERDPLPAEIDHEYGLRTYIREVLNASDLDENRQSRCFRCYRLRLDMTARQARASGASCFSSTLLASREQDRPLVEEAGRAAAEKAGVEFIAADLRQFLPDEKMLRGIYKQQYCGCVFSEDERFRTTNKHLYLAERTERAADDSRSTQLGHTDVTLGKDDT